MKLRDYIMALIGSDLNAVGASHFRETLNGEERVLLFSVANRRVAVASSPRNGVSGYISDASMSDDATYATWPTIWAFAGLPQAENFEQLDEIIDQFPNSSDEVVRFIGATLRARLH